MLAKFLQQVLLIAFAFVSPIVALGDDHANQKLPPLISSLQGSWEMTVKLDGKVIRSVKTVKGLIETVERFDVKTNKLIGRHQTRIEVQTDGAVNVLSFRTLDKQDASPLSYVFKIEGDTLFEITGILSGKKYRNNSAAVRVFRWERMKSVALRQKTKR